MAFPASTHFPKNLDLNFAKWRVEKAFFLKLTANQRSNSESIDENIIATFAAGEEFRDDVDIRIDCSTGIQHVLQ